MINEITPEMLGVLDETEKEKLGYIIDSINKNQVTSPLVVKYFSDIAFSLAIQSHRKGAGIPLAEILKQIFNDYTNSSLISIETKAKNKELIADTKMDLYYATGNHRISSLRLAPYIR